MHLALSGPDFNVCADPEADQSQESEPCVDTCSADWGGPDLWQRLEKYRERSVRESESQRKRGRMPDFRRRLARAILTEPMKTDQSLIE